MQCSRCQRDNAVEARFCGECGARLELACPACRAPNPPANKFCQSCGAGLTGGGDARFASPEAYTPTHLARKILTAQASALPGERKQVTVLFADLKGSLELLADRDPEDARVLLDGVLERLMEAVHRFEGTVNQVMGDGIMALFGAPLAHEDHAVRACYAALRMQRSVARLAEETRRQQGLDVQIRIGVNSGEVVVRSIGSDLKMDYTAVGQTTHLAARVEQLARPGTTLITAVTRRLADRHVVVEPRGEVPIRGLKDPIEVFELTGAAPLHARRGPGGRALSRFVGRHREMDLLRQRLGEAQAGRGQIVDVVGEAGVGKSRLLAELLAGAPAQGWLVLDTQASALAKGTPWAPLVALLAAYFHVDPEEDALAIRTRVVTRILAFDAGLAWAVPALMALGNLPTADPEWEALAPPERRRQILSAVTGIVLGESRRQPVLLILENLHWTDSETLAWLAELTDHIRTARVLVLTTYRPGYRPDWAGRPNATALRVEPFAGDAARNLVDEALGRMPELAPLASMLAERTGGNPFFVEECVRSLVEAGVLAGERGAHQLAKPLAGILIPDRVQAVLAARVDRLPEESKRLLQASAVIGREVPFALLQAVTAVPTQTLLDGLAVLEDAELLFTANLYPDLAYAFKHALTHDVVYSGLLKEQRRALHERIVETLATVHRDRREEHIEALAHHALGAECWMDAVGYLRDAAAKALARSANREAVAFLEQALEALRQLRPDPATVLQGIDVRLDLRPPLLQLGRLDDILRLSGEAATMAEQSGDEARQARAYSYLVNYHYLRGEPGVAIAYGERCLALAARTRDQVLAALARRYMGHCYHAQGQAHVAARLLQETVEALDAAPGSQPSTAAVTAYVSTCGWLAFALADLGDFDGADAWAARGYAYAEAARHPYSEAIGLTMIGLAALQRGHVDRAVGPLTRALAICRDSNLTVWQAIPASLLGAGLIVADRKDDGLELLEEGVRLSDELGVRAYLARWTALLAEGLLAVGAHRRALEVATRALGAARAYGERAHEAEALRVLAAIAAAQEGADVRVVIEQYREAAALAEELGLRPLLARVHLGIGQAYRQAGRLAEAEAHVATAVVVFSDLGMRVWLERAYPELRGLGHLVIVARPQLDLFEYLRQKFDGDPDVDVILDRRHREGGEGVGPPTRPRAGDRRRRAVDDALRTRGLAVVVHR